MEEKGKEKLIKWKRIHGRKVTIKERGNSVRATREGEKILRKIIGII